jgi:hypothetical protein
VSWVSFSDSKGSNAHARDPESQGSPDVDGGVGIAHSAAVDANTDGKKK